MSIGLLSVGKVVVGLFSGRAAVRIPCRAGKSGLYFCLCTYYGNEEMLIEDISSFQKVYQLKSNHKTPKNTEKKVKLKL